MLFVDAIAVASIVFACIEGFKAWGVAAPIGIGVGFGLCTLLIPYGGIASLVACMIIFKVARSSRMSKIINEPEETEPLNNETDSMSKR